jgi:hypothetical protein
MFLSCHVLVFIILLLFFTGLTERRRRVAKTFRYIYIYIYYIYIYIIYIYTLYIYICQHVCVANANVIDMLCFIYICAAFITRPANRCFLLELCCSNSWRTSVALLFRHMVWHSTLVRGCFLLLLIVYIGHTLVYIYTPVLFDQKIILYLMFNTLLILLCI